MMSGLTSSDDSQDTHAVWPRRYHLGLPAWAFSGWAGQYFDNNPSALASYSRVFNTVEGNTTFYHIPDAATVAGWCESLLGTGMQMCFKLPRSVTHIWPGSEHDRDLFFERMQQLQPFLGPFLLQFPASVGPDKLAALERFCEALPQQHRYVLEVRHPGWFAQPELLEPLLAEHGMGRVMMDTRAIFRGNKKHPEVLSALHEKPHVPVLGRVYNKLLFVRLLLHPDGVSNEHYINQWVARCAQALERDWECYMMIHCPNNQHCPAMAEQFHRRLQHAVPGLAALPSWPVPQQLGIF